ncbi:Homeodomain-like DNA binding domain-containing transcription factor [Mucor lusitanicus]|uniref:Homeodomain-like DNA binding domain-containing transcription factor n=2 Tax=Mucor circinelloides f. lusitanicus TaxID=29924 RepID=A0A168MF85_MUCCL|nr:Homeodomain-like DNA binding domain-containing transcription factor [Mucor lusitanicus CBS 277.49]
MNYQEFTAVEGLLSLYSCPPSASSQVSLQSYDSEYSVRLSPISPANESAGQRLPSIAQVLSSPPSDAFMSPASSMSSLNLHLSTPTMCPSMSSSCSTSTASSISSQLSDYAPQQAPRKTLRRTTTGIFPANRRGRPRKNPNPAAPTTAVIATTNTPTTTNKKGSSSKGKKRSDKEIKIIKSEYEKTSTPGVDPVSSKPRWQDVERQTLMEVIVQEKELDNMASIPWDKVSNVVGRAKKACQDQWRREILPYLLKGFVRQTQGCFEDRDSEMTDKQ